MFHSHCLHQGGGNEFEEYLSSRPKVSSFADVQTVGIKRRQTELGVNTTKQVVFYRSSQQMRKYLRFLYLKVEINGVSVGRVLIDNGTVINTIPFPMLRRFGKSEGDLMPSSVVLTDFSGEVAECKGIIALNVTVDSMTRTIVFFVMSTYTSYNVLLRRDWIHDSGCIPS